AAGSKTRDAYPCAEDVVEMFLLGPVVFTRAGDAETKRVAIKFQTRLSISHDDRGVIDPEKKLVLTLPLLIAFTGRELQDLEPVLVGIAKVKCLDAARVFVPVGQTLWTSGSMFDFI